MEQNKHNNTQNHDNEMPEEVINDENISDENVSDENIEATENADENAEPDELESLKKELEDTKNALEKEKKEYLFLMADFDNFRKRSLKERSELIKNAAEKVLKDLLPIVDDFERGLEAGKDATEAKAIHEGMQLIYNKLLKHLSDNGVKPMDTTGADFDADIHEAIATIPATDDAQKGKIIDTTQKGYTINDKVLRHAKVVVAQ